MKNVFGYPEFDAEGEEILCTYDNAYSDMLMDIRVYRMEPGRKRGFCRRGEETAVLLLSGTVTFGWEGRTETVSRRDVFTDGPYALHACAGEEITVEAQTDAEILVQCTKNDTAFSGRLYRPEDAPWVYSCVGKFGNVAKRRVNTIFDKDIAPWSNMVLGEVLNDRGNWSGYLPHRHPPAGVLLLQVRPAGGLRRQFCGGPGIQERGQQLLRHPRRVPASPGSGAGLPDVYLLDDPPSGRQPLAADHPQRGRAISLASRCAGVTCPQRVEQRKKAPGFSGNPEPFYLETGPAQWSGSRRGAVPGPAWDSRSPAPRTWSRSTWSTKRISSSGVPWISPRSQSSTILTSAPT